MNLFLWIVTGFVVVYLLSPFTKKMALHWHVVDVPGGRKQHGAKIPLSGGWAIYLGLSLIFILQNEWSLLHRAIVLGGLPIMLVGTLDDWSKGKGRDFSPLIKLMVQLAVASAVFAMGIRLVGIRNFLQWNGVEWMEGPFLSFPLWLSFLTTVLWLAGMMNMINFLDGMDGLAGGVVTIAGFTLLTVTYVKGQEDIAWVAAILVGGCLAFLRHNFYPASIFLGDAGSMFLGYLLALTSLYGAVKSATLFSVLITVLALGVPVVDTIQVIISRIRHGLPIYHADRRHVHHRLLQLGFTQKQTVFLLYLVSIVFSMISLILIFYIL